MKLNSLHIGSNQGSNYSGKVVVNYKMMELALMLQVQFPYL